MKKSKKSKIKLSGIKNLGCFTKQPQWVVASVNSFPIIFLKTSELTDPRATTCRN